ncbi:MAG: hypothetical protein CMP22_01790 [Rickettsiales bacterium]|nr:hypothetical protein [Rickettsiales bacterium]|tara:strand:+ start:199 stop:819 length:621 start_codon:yes stop_codon:yes gene_type:complete
MTNEFKIKRPELDPSFAHEEKRILNLYRSRIEQSNLKEPTFIHMGGLPGAGKTTLAVSYLENELKGQGFIRIDFDDIMTELDGYEESSMINPEQAYDEFWQPAASIGYKIIEMLVNEKTNILLDHSGAPEYHIQILKEIKEIHNYKTKMIYAECPIEMVKMRVKVRELRTKRHVPEQLILDRDKSLAKNFKHYQEALDEVVVIETF